jgi:hypothetical protein
LTNAEKIASYLLKSLGFNSIIKKGSKEKTEPFIYNVRNQYTVSFRQYDYNPESKRFWVTSRNGTYFYSLIQEYV